MKLQMTNISKYYFSIFFISFLTTSLLNAQNSGVKITYAPPGIAYDYIKPAAMCPNQSGGATVVYNYSESGLQQAGIVEFDSDGNVLGGIAEVNLQNTSSNNYAVTQIIPYSVDKYFLTGWVESSGQKDVFVTLITDYNGSYSEVFYKEIDIAVSNQDDIPLDAVKSVTADEFIVVGKSLYNGTYYEGFTVRVDAGGSIKTGGSSGKAHGHNITGNMDQALNSITALNNGDYVVLGYTKEGSPNDSSIAAKISGIDDSVIKSASYVNGIDSVIFDDLAVNKDGNFIAVGHTGYSTPPFYNGGSFILELDPNLVVLSSTIFNPTNLIKSIHPTQSGHFVTAWTEFNLFDPAKNNDIKIALHDKHGKMIKAIHIGTEFDDYMDGTNNLIEDSNGNIWALGRSSSTGSPDKDSLIIIKTDPGFHSTCKHNITMDLESNVQIVKHNYTLPVTQSPVNESVPSPALSPSFLSGGGNSLCTAACLNPYVDFTVNQISGTQMEFFSQSTGGTGYSWSFGSTNQDDVYDFGSPGTYNVTLTVNNVCGSSSITKEVVVADNNTTLFRQFSSAGKETIHNMQTTADGGMIYVGTTDGSGFGNKTNAGINNVFVAKTDENGNTEFVNTLGGSGSDEAIATVEDSNGNVIIVGNTINSFGNNDYDIFVTKLNSFGNTVWHKKYDIDAAGANDYARTVVLDNNGNIIVGGTSEAGIIGGTDGVVFKIDGSGNFVWANAYGGTGDDEFNEGKIDGSGNFVWAGTTSSFGAGGDDALGMKIDGSGNFVWANAYGGIGDENMNSGKIDGSGNFVWAGSTSSYGNGGDDGFVMKIDGSGNFVWANAYGGTGNDVINDGKIDGSGNFVWAGTTSSFGAGGDDGLSLKIDGSGNFVWANAYGSTGDESGVGARSTSSGGTQFIGTSNSFSGDEDPMIITTDANGSASCSITTSINSSSIANSGISPTKTTITSGQINQTAIAIASTSQLVAGVNLESEGAGDTTVCINTTPLHVEDMILTGQITENGSVQLNWSTSFESNNEGFEVLKALDGESFEKIGFVNGTNAGFQSTSYTFNDKSAQKGILKYKLKQLDYDGTATFSNLVEINNINSFTNVSIYPNPITDEANLAITGFDNSDEITAKITDAIGKIIYNSKNNASQISQDFTKISSNLASGTYILSLKSKTYIKHIKFVKQ